MEEKDAPMRGRVGVVKEPLAGHSQPSGSGDVTIRRIHVSKETKRQLKKKGKGNDSSDR